MCIERSANIPSARSLAAHDFSSKHLSPNRTEQSRKRLTRSSLPSKDPAIPSTQRTRPSTTTSPKPKPKVSSDPVETCPAPMEVDEPCSRTEETEEGSSTTDSSSSSNSSCSRKDSPAKTTAILDWDDTICPSTHLASLGLRVDDPSALPLSLQRQLEELETAVINIVEEALRFGEVVIITNAEAGWVELSGRRFLPRVVSFLNKHDIKIVSARSSFESHYPDAPSSWKMAAFSQEVDVLFPNEEALNVLVLGDSMSERDAAHALSNRLPQSKIKTVKFVERPSIDQLMRQVQLVAQSLPDLASYASSFDLDLVVSATA